MRARVAEAVAVAIVVTVATAGGRRVREVAAAAAVS